jgi:hypothetical protein
MGAFMKEDDIYIASLLDLLNLRFAPSQDGDEWFGGLEEMIALQKEFKIFKRGRSFKDSVRILNLGGFWNNRAKNRWYKLLEDLKKYKSNKAGENGDQSIVKALIKNLASNKPLPVHFEAHDSREPGGDLVLVDQDPKPIFYIEEPPYLTISLPMKPKPKRSRS